jgi:hypothetical protein
MKHLENITLIRKAVAAVIILAVAGARGMGWLG